MFWACRGEETAIWGGAFFGEIAVILVVRTTVRMDVGVVFGPVLGVSCGGNCDLVGYFFGENEVFWALRTTVGMDLGVVFGPLLGVSWGGNCDLGGRVSGGKVVYYYRGGTYFFPDLGI